MLGELLNLAALLDQCFLVFEDADLDRALDGCLHGEFAAMVTAPVHKGVINEAGIAFTGHTEYLAEKTGALRVVMMLAGGGLRVALATTHLPLKEVPAAITADLLERTLRILHADLQGKYGLDDPRILVAGLNPHAGEGGYLGREEIEVISPLLEKLRTENALRSIPVVILTGADLTPEQHKQLSDFGSQMLTKSMLREKELLSVLEDVLRKVKA